MTFKHKFCNLLKLWSRTNAVLLYSQISSMSTGSMLWKVTECLSIIDKTLFVTLHMMILSNSMVYHLYQVAMTHIVEYHAKHNTIAVQTTAISNGYSIV